MLPGRTSKLVGNPLVNSVSVVRTLFRYTTLAIELPTIMPTVAQNISGYMIVSIILVTLKDVLTVRASPPICQ